MDGKLYRTMEFIMNAFILNLLWLVICLPILTIFPATTAMFGVVREWQKQKDIRIISAFFRHFKANFKQSLILGVLWLTVTCLLIVDIIFTIQIESGIKYVLLSFFLLLIILYVFVSITIFPVLVHYKVSWKNALKNAFLLSIGKLHYTILSLLVLALATGVIFYFPAATMVCFSIGAYLIYALVSKGFQDGKNVIEEGHTAAV